MHAVTPTVSNHHLYSNTNSKIQEELWEIIFARGSFIHFASIGMAVSQIWCLYSVMVLIMNCLTWYSEAQHLQVECLPAFCPVQSTLDCCPTSHNIRSNHIMKESQSVVAMNRQVAASALWLWIAAFQELGSSPKDAQCWIAGRFGKDPHIIGVYPLQFPPSRNFLTINPGPFTFQGFNVSTHQNISEDAVWIKRLEWWWPRAKQRHQHPTGGTADHQFPWLEPNESKNLRRRRQGHHSLRWGPHRGVGKVLLSSSSFAAMTSDSS